MGFALTDREKIGAGKCDVTYVEVVFPRTLNPEFSKMVVDLLSEISLSPFNFYMEVSSRQIIEDYEVTGLLYHSCLVGPNSLEKIENFLKKHEISMDQYSINESTVQD